MVGGEGCVWRDERSSMQEVGGDGWGERRKRAPWHRRKYVCDGGGERGENCGGMWVLCVWEKVRSESN